MRPKISDRTKEEIIRMYLHGLTRDPIAKKSGVSTGSISGVIKEFTEVTDHSSLKEAAQEYVVVETFESLRSLAVEIRKAGTNVQELMELSHLLKRVNKLIDLETLGEFIKAGNSLRDKAHVMRACIPISHAVNTCVSHCITLFLRRLKASQTSHPFHFICNRLKCHLNQIFTFNSG